MKIRVSKQTLKLIKEQYEGEWDQLSETRQQRIVEALFEEMVESDVHVQKNSYLDSLFERFVDYDLLYE